MRLVFKQRIFFTCLLFLASFASMYSTANAQNYPNKVVKLVVPATAGGGADFVSRTISN